MKKNNPGIFSKNNGKKPIPKPNKNLSKSEAESDVLWTEKVWIRVLLLALFIIGMATLLPFNTFRGLPPYEINEPWRHADLVAPFDFALQKPSTQYDNELEQIRQNTPLIFNRIPNAYLESMNKLDSTFNALQPLILSYNRLQQSRADANRFETVRDSVQFTQLKEQIAPPIQDRNLRLMLDYFASQATKQLQSNINNEEMVIFGLSEKERLGNQLRELYKEAIINIPKSALERDIITIRQPFNNSQQTVSPDRLLDISEAMLKLNVNLSRDPMISEIIEPALKNIVSSIFEANYRFDEEATDATFQEAIRVVSTNQGAIAREQMIVRKGDLVSPDTDRILKSLEKALGSTASLKELGIRFGGDVLILLLLCIAYIFYFYLYAKDIFMNNNQLLMVVLTVLLLSTLHRFISPTGTLSPYFTPIVLVPILFTVFLNSRIGLVTAFYLPFMVSLISGPDYQFIFSSVLVGITATYTSRDLKDRMQFYVFTPGLVFLVFLAVHSGFTFSRYADLRAWAEPIFYFGVHSASIFFIYPLAMAYERLFGITTDFTLLELGDTNHPLLKELMSKAPGTFHHSLQVANLSEAAANALGANALLCKTACYYHDIGKIKRPYYFAENQGGENEHDSIKPSMSAMIIKDHVNQGVIMAEEAGLPKAIIDFIETHHGTTTIRYFYSRAKDQAAEGEEVDEALFKYDGPLPFSRETGIVMLADTVEAASRAMKQPTYSKLENLINKLVDAKVDEGQLANTPLTFKDLRKIKEVFLTILSGIYHSRVEYPEEKSKTVEKKTEEKE
jgi:putative nucleotidyltransferase with HDIG domain